ncbi:MAG: hypothetical protein ACTSYB_18495, partial [Candidatus Helarchaeota archaeon]
IYSVCVLFLWILSLSPYRYSYYYISYFSPGSFFYIPAIILMLIGVVLYWIDYFATNGYHQTYTGLKLGIAGWTSETVGIIMNLIYGSFNYYYLYSLIGLTIGIIIFITIGSIFGTLVFTRQRTLRGIISPPPAKPTRPTPTTARIKVPAIPRPSDSTKIPPTERMITKIQSQLDECIRDWKKITCNQGSSASHCSGPTVYVCHHCKTPLCYDHSYWIPDIKFPRFCKKKIEVVRMKTGLFIAALATFIGLLILGIIFIAQGTIGFLIAGFVLIGLHFLGFIPLTLAKEVIPFFSTHYIYRPTIWNFMEKEGWIHEGFFLAVHCWNCLNQYHSEIITEAEDLMTQISRTNWFEKNVKLNNHSRIDIGNLYLDMFKWGETFASTNSYLWIPFPDGKAIKIFRKSRSALYWNVRYKKNGEFDMIDKNQKATIFKQFYYSTDAKKFYWNRYQKPFKT